jgi:hypothetical protein
MDEWTIVKHKKSHNQSNTNLFHSSTVLNDTINEEYIEHYPFDMSQANLEYKKVNDHNIPDLEMYFKGRIRDYNNFKKIISANANIDIKPIKLISIINSVKITKDINKCYVVLVFSTDNTLLPFCVISYKLNMFYLDKNEYCVFLRNWVEVIVYLFKFELDIKNDPSKSMIANYPLDFYENKIRIINYINQFTKIWR